MTTGGHTCAARASDIGCTSLTLLLYDEPIDIAGTVTNICIHTYFSNPTLYAKVKIFRLNGSNYDCIHTSPSWVNISGTGQQNFNVNWEVEAGDYVGASFSDSGSNAYISASITGSPPGPTYTHSGDVTTSTATSTWSSISKDTSIYATGVTADGTKYVDISTGSDSDSGNTWALAYLTVKKGIDNVVAGKVLHIAEGDYSAQAAIDLDKNLELLCEDYGGGNANPPLTVILPATT